MTQTRKNALFAGSDGGARHWALTMTLIQTAKLNGIDPLTWLTDRLEQIVCGRTKVNEMHTLLPWTCDAAKANSEAEQLTAYPARPVKLYHLSAPHRVPRIARRARPARYRSQPILLNPGLVLPRDVQVLGTTHFLMISAS